MGNIPACGVILVAYCLIAVSLNIFTEALNLKDAEEGRCFQIPKSIIDKDINSTWMNSVPAWYIPLANRYEYYRIVMNHLGLGPEDEQFKGMSDEKLINKSCFKFWLHMYSSTGALYGFEKPGYSRVVVQLSRSNVIDMLTNPPMIGMARHYVTLTDYKTFVVLSNCWLESNQKSWEVVSTTKTLSSEALQMIEEHVKSLGFNPEQFMSLNYGNCNV
ncbi:hypothetical protein Ocin01_07246 [Orchesella cincta]|uniref:Uncharacterized protein n=1 Tax=Orchesella cincta TaxID=48709 RepID=A0A1D2N2D7_ORCCI|nr:hypothetical protein Ocin01_07246 [Orchesella cincta]